MFNYNTVSFEDSKKKLHTYKLLEIINSIYRQRQMAIFNQDWNLVDKLNFHGQILWDKSMPNGTPKRSLNYSRIINLGWKPKYKLNNGLKKLYEWFKENF